MNAYSYHWSICQEAGPPLELWVTAPSVSEARREVHRLVDRAGGYWSVECISREAVSGQRVSLAVPLGRASRSSSS